ncbi:MAG: hypothetical protein IJP48_03385 [Synergistaceae bacterium]|nr:hypothetical protein [Synergistaceae bacterium]
MNTESTLNEWYTFGDHLYRKYGDDPSIIFTGTSGEKKIIVDYDGYIQNFPGIDPETIKIIQPYLEESLSSKIRRTQKIRYRTDFSLCDDGRIIMIWQIQPDGMYWADEDGYGMTSDEEICLYSFIDDNGNFTMPFKLYKIGVKKFY